MSKKTLKRSQMPYEISTTSIGDILMAKANNGDKKAQRAAYVMLRKRGGTHGSTKSNISIR